MPTESLYTRAYRIGSADSDYMSLYRPSALLEHMQLAADGDLSSMGITVSEMLAQGLGWMLLTTDLTILRPARLEEEVSLQTWHKGNKGVMWLRDFVLSDNQENVIAEARTTWALVDMQKRKLLRPTALPFEVRSHPARSLGDIPAKVSLPDSLQTWEADRFEVRYSSTDSNGHMNNARYADLCCDTLTTEELETGIRRLQISYHREVRMHEQVVVERSAVVDNGIWVRGMAPEDRGTIFEARLTLNEADTSR
ncbi:acyl-[acyl-carrier-protein] thioesterase [Paenibacillus hubeiensis]|uniref:acyl-[acyl-carrier-protein] thioesterase n=1 Tax=Paenibacillus hubeiensis TaxID=3077330 RepID=UPI0031BA7B33